MNSSSWFESNLRLRVSGGGADSTTGPIGDFVEATLGFNAAVERIANERIANRTVAALTVNVFQGQLLDVAQKLAIELR